MRRKWSRGRPRRGRRERENETRREKIVGRSERLNARFGAARL